MIENRAGTFIQQPSGYKSFIPKRLPPNPPIDMSSEMISLLSKAERNLGRLDGVTQTLPNPALFVAMYVRKEAVLSSQIEGTQASLTDVLTEDKLKHGEVVDVINYVKAMNYGLDRINKLPLSLRLIKEIHSVLLSEGRGSTRNPGEFRRSQNWIGPSGCTLTNATFVPPAVPDMIDAMNDLESFLYYESEEIPALIQIALIHAQFESIHPFLDGNGRMGRLLITFWLCQREILSQPLLYLSYYFKQYRIEYYDLLMNVRLNGDWESWIKFFLKGVASVSDEATKTAKDILELKRKCESKIKTRNNSASSRLLDRLFETPIVSKNDVEKLLNLSAPTAGKLVDQFCNDGILSDITPNKKRYKEFMFSEYISILNRGTEIQ